MAFNADTKRLDLWSNHEYMKPIYITGYLTNSSIGAIPAHHTVDSLVLTNVIPKHHSVESLVLTDM